MAEIKFACPGCEQHIACDTGYSGMEISCPACKAKMIVPQLPGTPAPPPRLSIGSTAPPPLPPPPSAEGRTCQSCGAGVEPDAMICTQCGTDLQTGQRIQNKPPTPGKPGAKRSKVRAKATGDEDTPWYKTVYPYLLILVGIIGALYYFGRENPVLRLAFGVLIVGYLFTAHVLVVIAAFREGGVSQGLLCLCIPFYATYYVYNRCDSHTIQVIYSGAIIIGLIIKFLVPRHSI